MKANSIINEVAQKNESVNSLIDNIIENAPKDAPITDEDIMQEIKDARYAV